MIEKELNNKKKEHKFQVPVRKTFLKKSLYFGISVNGKIVGLYKTEGEALRAAKAYYRTFNFLSSENKLVHELAEKQNVKDIGDLNVVLSRIPKSSVKQFDSVASSSTSSRKNSMILEEKEPSIKMDDKKMFGIDLYQGPMKIVSVYDENKNIEQKRTSLGIVKNLNALFNVYENIPDLENDVKYF